MALDFHRLLVFHHRVLVALGCKGMLGLRNFGHALEDKDDVAIALFGVI